MTWKFMKEIVFGAKASVSCSMQLRTTFSYRHIKCATMCTKKSIEIENNFVKGSTWEEHSSTYDENQACASGAIISSVAYLESFINEFFNNCENDSDFFKEINKEKNDLLKRHWKKGIKCRRTEKFSAILCKYQVAYCIFKGIGIDNSSKKFDNVKDLIKIRNALVHYKSEFQPTHNSDSEVDPYGLNHLQGKFNENIFMINCGNPFFPWKCLGAGCAKWAIKTSIDFTDYFSSEINLNKNDFVHELLKEI